jgi:hypothetical protein
LPRKELGAVLFIYPVWKSKYFKGSVKRGAVILNMINPKGFDKIDRTIQTHTVRILQHT